MPVAISWAAIHSIHRADGWVGGITVTVFAATRSGYRSRPFPPTPGSQTIRATPRFCHGWSGPTISVRVVASPVDLATASVRGNDEVAGVGVRRQCGYELGSDGIVNTPRRPRCPARNRAPVRSQRPRGSRYTDQAPRRQLPQLTMCARRRLRGVVRRSVPRLLRQGWPRRCHRQPLPLRRKPGRSTTTVVEVSNARRIGRSLVACWTKDLVQPREFGIPRPVLPRSIPQSARRLRELNHQSRYPKSRIDPAIEPGTNQPVARLVPRPIQRLSPSSPATRQGRGINVLQRRNAVRVDMNQRRPVPNEGWTRAITKVGLEIGPRTLRPSPSPRVKVVLPAPSGPSRIRTSPAWARDATSRPQATICSADCSVSTSCPRQSRMRYGGPARSTRAGRSSLRGTAQASACALCPQATQIPPAAFGG